MPDDRPPTARRRRRAVGPPGAQPSVPDLLGQDLPGTDSEPPPDDDDERLRQEVPPHHGS